MASSGWNWVSQSGMVVAEGDTFSIQAETLPDARVALKELKFLKKDLQLEKKMVAADLKVLRTSRSQQVASQGSMMRGGGQGGQVLRTFQRIGRDHDRSKHASNMAPYQQAIAELDERINQVDKVIATLDRHIHLLQQEQQATKDVRPPKDVPAFPVCSTCGMTEEIGARFCGTCGGRL